MFGLNAFCVSALQDHIEPEHNRLVRRENASDPTVDPVVPFGEQLSGERIHGKINGDLRSCLRPKITFKPDRVAS